MTTEITLLKLLPIVPHKTFVQAGLANPNYYKALIGIKTEGGLVPATIDSRHLSFYKKEFNLNDEEVQKLIVK